MGEAGCVPCCHHTTLPMLASSDIDTETRDIERDRDTHTETDGAASPVQGTLFVSYLTTQRATSLSSVWEFWGIEPRATSSRTQALHLPSCSSMACSQDWDPG